MSTQPSIPPETQTAPSEALALLLVEARYERLHAAFMMAATALALGRPVILFGMGSGVAAFCRSWSGVPEHVLGEAGRLNAGVAGVEVLRDAVQEMGAEMMVCDSGLKAMNLAPQDLVEGVRVVGLPTFLDCAATARQLVF
ncbi:MAG: DsrE family protein [Acetobacter papayae]|uniref:DsrE family protein n=1 Tax=Acetobacter papayae TaxID=1076592 RepID=UPI0039E7F1EA